MLKPQISNNLNIFLKNSDLNKYWVNKDIKLKLQTLFKIVQLKTLPFRILGMGTKGEFSIFKIKLNAIFTIFFIP